MIWRNTLDYHRRWIVGLLFTSIFGLPILCTAKEPNVTLLLDPKVGADWKTTAVWYGYILARVKYRKDHKLPTPESGTVSPVLDEEVSSRMKAVQIYQQLKDENNGYFDAYWEILSKIKAKGFMSAYVWTYLHQASWPKSGQPQNLSAFQAWTLSHLKGHKATTLGAVVVETR
jgi:hypothetical protein